MRTVPELVKRGQEGPPITMLTCYDYTSARIANASPIDCLLVGDSAAMVMHGHPTTIGADLDMLALHVAAVARGAPDKLLVADLPFLAHRKGRRVATEAAERLVRAGAQIVKLEGAAGHLDVIAHLTQSGVPVMGHLGLTPQAVHALGGYQVQAREPAAAERLTREAIDLQAAGCCALVLECVPGALAAAVTERLAIPTIGIGAGPGTSGQVLVWQDLLGLDPSFQPRFVRRYLDGQALIAAALERYCQDVTGGQFPSPQESFS